MDTQIQCHLFEKTPSKEDIEYIHTHFKHIKEYVDESHLFRYLLKCDKCGQLYFYEFNEEIDWQDGDDSQYNTYIPVKSEEEADEMNKKNSFELLAIKPRIQHDVGKGNTGEVRLIS